jgi:hypothetical protein
MDQKAKAMACQLFIQQEIEKGLKAGKKKWHIAKEIVDALRKFFNSEVSPHTLNSRIRYEENLLNHKPKTSQKETVNEKTSRQGQSDGPRMKVGKYSTRLIGKKERDFLYTTDKVLVEKERQMVEKCEFLEAALGFRELKSSVVGCHWFREIDLYEVALG